MSIKTLAPVFFFLFLFISLSAPALAYFPVSLNISKSYGTDTSVNGVNCLNATDNKVYCYVQTQAAIYKYNSTWGNEQSCIMGHPSTIGYSYMTDENTLYFKDASATLVNLTNISLGGFCPTTAITSGSFISGETYVSGRSNSQVFNNYNILTSGNVYVAPGFWTSTFTELSVPSKTDNSTLYGAFTRYNAQHSDFTKYTNGIASATIDDPMTLWGIGNSAGSNDGWGVYCSIVRTNGTDWAYCVDSNTNALNGFTTSYLYKVNFTQAGTFSPSKLTPVSPSQGQIVKLTDNYVPLVVNLTTTNSGILYFYYNNVYLTELPLNGTNINNGIYTTSAPFNGTDGAYSWRAYYVDNASVQWSTALITFSISSGVSANDLLNNPAESMALLVGGFFGTDDQDTSENISSILFALIGSLIVTLLAAYYGKIKGQLAGGIFIVSFMAFIVFFTMLGWLNPAIMVILIILTAVIVAKMFGLIGQGGG